MQAKYPTSVSDNLFFVWQIFGATSVFHFNFKKEVICEHSDDVLLGGLLLNHVSD